MPTTSTSFEVTQGCSGYSSAAEPRRIAHLNSPHINIVRAFFYGCTCSGDWEMYRSEAREDYVSRCSVAREKLWGKSARRVGRKPNQDWEAERPIKNRTLPLRSLQRVRHPRPTSNQI